MVAEDNLLVEKSGEGIVLSLGVNTDYSSVSPSEDLSGSTASSGRFKNSEVSKFHCALNQLYIFHPGGMAGGVVQRRHQGRRRPVGRGGDGSVLDKAGGDEAYFRPI